MSPRELIALTMPPDGLEGDIAALKTAAFCIESVAHLQGKEHLLPLSDRVRAIAQRMAQVPGYLPGALTGVSCPRCGQLVTDGKPCGCGAR